MEIVVTYKSIQKSKDLDRPTSTKVCNCTNQESIYKFWLLFFTILIYFYQIWNFVLRMNLGFFWSIYKRLITQSTSYFPYFKNTVTVYPTVATQSDLDRQDLCQSIAPITICMIIVFYQVQIIIHWIWIVHIGQILTSNVKKQPNMSLRWL